MYKRQNENDQRIRINVRKIIPLDEILNKPINNLKIKINNTKDLIILSNILKTKGNVEIMFELEENNKKYTLKLKNKRFVDRNVLNTIKNQGILTSIL